MVVRGFKADGSVIANDPASPNNAAVRHVYQRDQFEFRGCTPQRESST